MMKFHGKGGNTGNSKTVSIHFPTHHVVSGMTTTNNNTTTGIIRHDTLRSFCVSTGASVTTSISYFSKTPSPKIKDSHSLPQFQNEKEITPT
jgi:hypothetical protein